MSLQFKLEPPEATFYLDIYKSIISGKECPHFAFDCPCGEKQGSRYKNAGLGTKNAFDIYHPFNTETAYTFYMNQKIFTTILDDWHNEKQDDKALIIICNSCEKEFNFTHQKYNTLVKQLRSQGIRTEIPE